MGAMVLFGRVALFGVVGLAGCGQVHGDSGAADAPANAGSAGTASGGSAGASVGASFHWIEPLTAHLQIGAQEGRQVSVRSESGVATVDGSVVAGNSFVIGATIGRTEAFRWTEASGSVSLGTFPGFDPNTSEILAIDMSADGAVIVGRWSSAGDQGGFRWTAEAGMTKLIAPSGWAIDTVDRVSVDGSIVVGALKAADSHRKAFRWTSDVGAVVLDGLPGDTDCQALWLSADGAVVLGNSWHSNTGQAFRWTQATGFVSLGLLPGHNNCQAQLQPRDGNGLAVTGVCDADPFRWTEASGIEALGTLPGHTSYVPWSISADGKAVIGDSQTPAAPEMFYWREGEGMVGLGFLPGGSSSFFKAAEWVEFRRPSGLGGLE